MASAYIETAKPTTKKSNIPELLANAEILFAHGEQQLATALLREILIENSYHPEALKKLARIEIKKKNWEIVIKMYQAIIKSDYNFENVAELAHAHYNLSQDMMALEKYEEALEIVFESCDGLFDVYKNMGNIYVKLNDFHSAEESYFKAISINKNSDTLFVNLGTLAIQKEDYNQAQEKFRYALGINPQNDKAWVGLAIVHEKVGDQQLAMANIENALDLNPINKTAVHICAHWATRTNNYELAVASLQNYLSRVEKDEEISLILIHVFCLMQKYHLAMLEIERVLLWNPQQEAVNKLLLEIERKPT